MQSETWEFKERPQERSRHFAWLDAVSSTGGKTTLGLLPASLVDAIIADHTAVSTLRTELEAAQAPMKDWPLERWKKFAQPLVSRIEAVEAERDGLRTALKKAQGKVHYLQHNAVYGTAETCDEPECAALHTPTGAGTAEPFFTEAEAQAHYEEDVVEGAGTAEAN